MYHKKHQNRPPSKDQFHGIIEKLRQNGEGPYKRNEITTGTEMIDQWKVITSYVGHDHAGNPGKDGRRRVLSKIDILPPGTICNETYLILLGPEGLDMPVAALTDMDPRPPKEDGSEREPLGPKRAVNHMLVHLVDEASWKAHDFDGLLAIAPEYGVLMNGHTFEVDLFQSGLQEAFAEAMDDLGRSARARERMKGWAEDPDTLEVETFLKDIENVGKGRFAQRLASIIVESDLTHCPQYIIDGVKHVSSRCKHS